MIRADSIPAAVLARMSPQNRARYAALQEVAMAPARPRQAPGQDVPLTPTAAAPTGEVEERRPQGEIIGWLRGMGYEPCYARMDRKSTLPLGWSDITVSTKSGRAVAMEVKTATGQNSEEQDARIAAMRRAGWSVAVVRSLTEAQVLWQNNEIFSVK